MTTDTLANPSPFTLHSQSETEQDAWVIRKLDAKRNGFFIEIGAFDGVYHSNTLALERELGWNGILIEAVPEYAARAAASRRAKVLNYAISPDSRKRDFYVAGPWSGLEEFTRPNLLANHAIFNNPRVTQPTVSLPIVLRAERLPEVVDYLSIDVEGAEYAILKNYFESSNARQFRCITVEIGDTQDELDKLIALLRPLGYRLDLVQAWEAYFVHKDLI